MGCVMAPGVMGRDRSTKNECMPQGEHDLRSVICAQGGELERSGGDTYQCPLKGGECLERGQDPKMRGRLLITDSFLEASFVAH
jgi:hypothetical protein